MNEGRNVQQTRPLMKVHWLILSALLYLGIMTGGCSAPSSTKHSLQSGTVTVGDVNIFYEGIGDGVPILVVHGGPGLDHGYLRPSLDRLTEAGRVYYYDQRSVGQSGGIPSPVSVNVQRSLADIEALRKGLGLERIHIIGHSWGAILAMLYAAQHPSHIYSLVMVTPSPATYEGMLHLEAMLRARRKKTTDSELTELAAKESFLLGETESVNHFMNLWFRPYLSPSTDPDILHFQLQPNTAQHWAQVNRYMIQQLGQYTFLPQAADIEVPTLLVQGEEDTIPTQSYQRIHTNIPKAEHVIIPDSGHFPFLEQPQPFFEAVLPFLRKHSE